jgi:aryl-alcohol dehydrogenase-like predicted oxidoreductase
MHGWDPLTPVEETLGFLDDAVHAGKIHYIGLSNFTGWQLQLTLSTAAALGLQLPVTLQQQYSLVCRENEYEVIPAALHNGVGLLPWSPLASGFLSGKYERVPKPPTGAPARGQRPHPRRLPHGPFGEKQRGRYVDSSEQVIGELS